ncbi:MAG: hypothetical protein KDM63_20930, partial [Verrucomicrobiae bacterium]|nr:hypothetical protein [Verrucomicrobiae bacterium]
MALKGSALRNGKKSLRRKCETAQIPFSQKKTKHFKEAHAMKQAFGIFAALVLVPSLQVQAWVGGPWGHESYQANGDDGVYEAVGTLTDGTAM